MVMAYRRPSKPHHPILATDLSIARHSHLNVEEDNKSKKKNKKMKRRNTCSSLHLSGDPNRLVEARPEGEDSATAETKRTKKKGSKYGLRWFRRHRSEQSLLSCV
jgi:hypothetical protein